MAHYLASVYSCCDTLLKEVEFTDDLAPLKDAISEFVMSGNHTTLTLVNLWKDQDPVIADMYYDDAFRISEMLDEFASIVESVLEDQKLSEFIQQEANTWRVREREDADDLDDYDD